MDSRVFVNSLIPKKIEHALEVSALNKTCQNASPGGQLHVCMCIVFNL